MAEDDLEPGADFASRFGEWTGQNIDWRTGKLLTQDPVAAINSMIDRGIPPPDFHAPMRDPSQGNLTDDLSKPPLRMSYGEEFGDEGVPPNASAPLRRANSTPPVTTAPTLSRSSAVASLDSNDYPADSFGSPPSGPAAPGDQNNPLPRGFSTRRFVTGFPQTDQPQVATAPPSVPVSAPRSQQLAEADTNPLDPPESIPLPRERPKEAGSGASDVSAKKKLDKADALSDFAKSLQGVKPIQPPPVNPVGTPSVRSPGAINAPNLQNLAMMGQAARANAVLPLLGRLLAMGKV